LDSELTSFYCNNFRREQTALQIEIEKMSDMIGELRKECQKLQQELQWAKQIPKNQRSIGLQVGKKWPLLYLIGKRFNDSVS